MWYIMSLMAAAAMMENTAEGVTQQPNHITAVPKTLAHMLDSNQSSWCTYSLATLQPQPPKTEQAS